MLNSKSLVITSLTRPHRTTGCFDDMLLAMMTDDRLLTMMTDTTFYILGCMKGRLKFSVCKIQKESL